MIKLNYIDHLNIFVNDLEETFEFYKEHFGFELKEEGVSSGFGNPFKIIGLSNKLLLAIYENGVAIDNSGLNHIGINVSNFDETVTYLKSKEVPLLYGGEIIEYPNSRSVYISDPNGLQIELSDVFGGGL